MTTLDDGKAGADEEDLWRHFGLDDDEITEYTALREDIPQWLETSLWGWIRDAFTVAARAPNRAHVDNELVRKCERVLEVPIPWPGGSGSGDFISVLRHAHNKRPDRDRAVWRLVNYLLAKGHAHGGTLKTYLLDARSVWTVAAASEGRCYLVRRVPEGVEVVATAAFKYANGGKRLGIAWETAFGVDPDPSKAYWFAVKAVEDASAPVVIPNDPTPTLGKVISCIEQGGRFKLPHLRENPDATSHDVLLKMLKLLWVGEYDRHGGMPPSPLPDDVTQDEAETAVMQAVTLVGLFGTGKVQP